MADHEPLANRRPAGVLATPPADCWELRRIDPPPNLQRHVAWLWAVSWDLRGRDDHVQSTLPHPSAHLVVEDGATYVYGPTRRRFTRTLSGVGRVVALRFHPAGLRAFTDVPIATLVDQRVAANEVLRHGDDPTAAVADRADLDEAMAALAASLEPAMATEDDDQVEVNGIVERIAEDRSIRTVDDLAAVTGHHRRSLQRLLARDVGLGPKAIIRRYRLQEAAAAALDGDDVDWALMAAHLGYYDQAHLVRHFTAVVGDPPATYARRHRP